MPLTPNLGLNRPAHGDYMNTWDQPVNDNWDKLDDLFSGFRWDGAPSGPGHTHDGTAGRGPKIRHTDLLDIGTKTHSDLDANFGKVMISSTDTTPRYLEDKLVAGANVVITKLGSPGDEDLRIAVPAMTPTLGDAGDPSGEYGWKHFVPTSAPVAYVDNFNYPSGFTLRQADYTVTQAAGSLTPGLPPDFITTGYSAVVYIDPQAGDDVIGKYAATVTCQIPHGTAQRVTLSVTKFDYSDMEAGDYAAFTMSLFSTHRLGAFLPQKHGVLLELHLVCLGGGNFQMTHRIFVLPDATTQVLLWQCQNHVGNPNDILGAWELSLDSNGHVYHYWRRRLVYSSQSTPPNIPGPVQGYLATLMASLVADGDQKYGAMGFGFHYKISDYSKFNMEFRWFSATSNADIYDTVPVACPGHIADTYGIVSLVDLPEAFFIVPPGVPGAQCCPAPNARNIGDVLESDLQGNPLVWVTGCNEISAPTDVDPDGKIKGYTTNLSGQGCLPCMSPIQEEPLQIFDLTGDWGYEGTTGKIVVHGVYPIPPLFELTPSDPRFHVIGAEWLGYNEFEIKYYLEDGTGGETIDLTITNSVDSARTFTFTLLDPVLHRTPEILSVSWLDMYTYHLGATMGYRCRGSVTGRGFEAGTTFTSTTAGVTINSAVVNSPTSATLDVSFNFATMTNGAPAAGRTFNILVDGAGTFTDVAVHPVPLLAYVSVTPMPGGMGIDVANDKTCEFHGQFFDVHGNLDIVCTDPTILLGPGTITIVSITQTVITVKYRIQGAGTTGKLAFQITNTVSGLSIVAPVGTVGDVAPPTIISVTMMPGLSALPPVPPTLYNGSTSINDRPIGPQGYPPYEFDVFMGGAPFDAAYVFLQGPPYGPLYPDTGYDSHTLARGMAGANGAFIAPCGSAGAPFVTALKPGIGVVTVAMTAVLANPLAPVIGLATFSGGAAPGATGFATFTFTSALVSYLTDIAAVSVSGVTFDPATRTVIAPDKLRYAYAIDPTVPSNVSVQINFKSGPCGPIGSISFLTEYADPVISAAEMNLYQDVTNNAVTLRGTGFVSGCTVAVGGNATYVGGSLVFVSSTELQLQVNNGAPGAATFRVTNPDTKISNLFSVTLLTELAADVDHTDGVDVTGTATTLYIYGENLAPPGAVYTFSGFTPSGAPTIALSSYIEINGTITAPAGGPVKITITSTSHVYANILLGYAKAAPAGDVVIDSIDVTTPKSNQTAVEIYVFGQNMHLVNTVEAIADTPARLSSLYAGPPYAVVCTVVSKTTTHLLLHVDIAKGVTPNEFTFNFYDAFLVLLATAPAAIHVMPSTNAAVISDSDRANMDTAIPTGAGASWGPVTVPVSAWHYGDNWVAIGCTITASYSAGNWLISGTNSGSPVPLELRLMQPAISEMTVYRRA